MKTAIAKENPIEVSAGLIFRGGKLLITRRLAGAPLGGLWEFPGGKREPGESFEQCLHRELLEELGVEVQIAALLDDFVHHYPGRSVRLQFFRCLWLRHEPRPILCDDLAWITAAQLSDYSFPAADARVLDKLRRSPELW
ncbi:MAG: (deoxy)nucleoside triphosphate pyrophosphohydrolase [Verrucomicrobiota bacterium]